MIKRWGDKLETLTQAQWLVFLDDTFSHAVGWQFMRSGNADHEEGIPNYDQLVAIDPMDLLSLGEEQLLVQEVDFEKGFQKKGEDSYGYKDESEPVDQDHYDQIEKLIHLSCIWHAHLKGGDWHKRPIFVPLPGTTRSEIKEKLNAFADEEGLIHEIRAWQEGVPFADIFAGYKYPPDPDHFYAGTNWIVSFDIS